MAELALESINYFLETSFDADRHMILNDVAQSQLAGMGFDTQASHSTIVIRNKIIPYATVTGLESNESSLLKLIKSTDIESQYAGIYEMFRLAILESWVIQYLLASDGTYLNYLTTKDVKRIRKNLNLLADFCGGFRAYRFLVEYIRDLELAIGYMQNQLELILQTSDLRYHLGDAN